MTTKYVARLNGEIIGKRSTAGRKYTHAVIILPSEPFSLAQAQFRKANDTDKSNFRYYCEVAEGRSQYEQTPEQIIRASTMIDGGFDAYVERQRMDAIKSHEERVAAGYFKPGVVTWCGRPDLAQKEASKRQGSPQIAQVWVVQAEEVIKAGAR